MSADLDNIDEDKGPHLPGSPENCPECRPFFEQCKEPEDFYSVQIAHIFDIPQLLIGTPRASTYDNLSGLMGIAQEEIEQLRLDFLLYGHAFVDPKTGMRVSPASVKIELSLVRPKPIPLPIKPGREQSKRLIDICLIPDCGCNGDAHP